MGTNPPLDPRADDDDTWCRDALAQVDAYRRELLREPAALRPAADYQAESTGKRLRPTVLLCFAMMGQAQPRPTPPVLRAAAAIELLHEASLIHDDILDHSTIRRGRGSVAEEYGVSTAAHLGAFVVMSAVSTLAEACEGSELDLTLLRTLCEAQLEEGLRPAADPATQRRRCVRVIQGKTGSLFKLAAQAGAGFVGPDHRRGVAHAAERFPERLAFAFQLRDDLGDLENDGHLNKPGGADLLRGVPTLPFQMWVSGRPDPQADWRRLDDCRDDAAASEALRQEILRSTVPHQIRELILAELGEARAALDELPACPARTTLGHLLDRIAPAPRSHR